MEYGTTTRRFYYADTPRIPNTRVPHDTHYEVPLRFSNRRNRETSSPINERKMEMQIEDSGNFKPFLLYFSFNFSSVFKVKLFSDEFCGDNGRNRSRESEADSGASDWSARKRQIDVL